MSKIAIVHPDLNKMGGAEAVCMNVIDSLASRYDVDLFTLTNPHKYELESYYDISLSANSVYTRNTLGPIIERTTSFLGAIAGVGNLGALDAALVNRLFSEQCSEYDLVISTMSEMSFETPSIQYIHYPNFYRSSIKKTMKFSSIYEYISQKIAGAEDIPKNSDIYIANSNWTAEKFEEIYGHCPEVIHPPIDTRGFNPIPWEAREEGILVVGRIGADKRLDGIIETFKDLKQNGYNGVLRIVGPVHDEDYYQYIRSKSNTVPDIYFEGKVSRDKLVSLMSRHRYAIHGKENEHFGMVVAEFVAAGMIPFVPDSGGQTDIVDNLSPIVYSTWADLESQFSTVVSHSELQTDILDQLPDIESQFGRKQFKKEVRTVVSHKLDG